MLEGAGCATAVRESLCPQTRLTLREVQGCLNGTVLKVFGEEASDIYWCEDTGATGTRAKRLNSSLTARVSSPVFLPVGGIAPAK